MALNTEIDTLDYGVVEKIIADYYDLGYPDTSSFPVEFEENSSDSYYLVGTKAMGKFYVKTAKITNGKYWLYVTVEGKTKKV